VIRLGSIRGQFQSVMISPRKKVRADVLMQHHRILADPTDAALAANSRSRTAEVSTQIFAAKSSPNA